MSYVEIEVKISANAQKNDTECIEVDHRSELGVDVTLSVPMNLWTLTRTIFYSENSTSRF